MKKIVVALGGNAILVEDPSESAQKLKLKDTSKFLVNLIKEGHKIIITHGNGPQVENLLLQQSSGEIVNNPMLGIDTCVGMTQGSIGYWLENALLNELSKNGISKKVVSFVTQVIVDPSDEAFTNPTKPIGPFYTELEAKEKTTKEGGIYKEYSGRGWRKVVPSPMPIYIMEKHVISSMLSQNIVVIAGFGGAIPIIKNYDNTCTGVECVIDKDFASAKISEIVDADLFVILTGVSYVAINYNKPGQRNLKYINLNELKKLKDQGHFAPGSMLPKIEAAIKFIEGNLNKKVIITSLENLPNIMGENPGTVIVG